MLSTTLDLDANPFMTAMHKVTHAVEGFRGRIITFVAAFEGIKIAGEAVVGVFEKLHGVFELGGQLNALKFQTGETASELLVLQQTFRNSGVSADQVSVFVARLHKAIGGLNDEGKNTAASFKELGTSAEALRALPLNEQVKKLAEGFQQIPDAARRGQTAMNLFGRTGEQFLGVFRNEEAMVSAREQVGGLGTMMDKVAPSFETIANALSAITLKFQQLSVGALSVVAPQFVTLAEALNHLDLTNAGVAIGHVALAVIKVAEAMKFLVPIVLSLGAGWLASMAATQIASIGIVTAVRAVTLATVGGIRAIMVALGPVGLAIAGLTYLWMKWRETTEKPAEMEVGGEHAKTVAAEKVVDDSMAKSAVSSLTARGLNAFGGIGTDLGSRIDRTNSLLEDIRAAVKEDRYIATPMQRADPAV